MAKTHRVKMGVEDVAREVEVRIDEQDAPPWGLDANLAVVGNGTIDTVMAGRLSATDLAAVAIGSSIYITIYIGFMGVLQALSPIAGHHFGARRWRSG